MLSNAICSFIINNIFIFNCNYHILYSLIYECTVYRFRSMHRRKAYLFHCSNCFHNMINLFVAAKLWIVVIVLHRDVIKLYPMRDDQRRFSFPFIQSRVLCVDAESMIWNI